MSILAETGGSYDTRQTQTSTDEERRAEALAITREAEQDHIETESRTLRGETHENRVARLRKLIPDAALALIEFAATACNPGSDPAATLHVCRLMAREDGWRAAEPANKDAIVVEACRAHRSVVADSTIRAILGRLDLRTLRWVDPPALEDDGADDDPFIFGGVPPATAEEVTECTSWAGRLSVIHGAAGCGKTTFLAWAVAVASRTGEKVLVLAPDDPDGWRTRLHQFGAEEEYVGVAAKAPLAALATYVERHKADLLVVDSLARVAAVEGANLDRTQDADRLVTPLVGIAREGCAVAVVHHEPWSDSGDRSTVARPRNSTSLTAAADAIVRVHRDGSTTTVEPGLKTRVGIPQVVRRYRLDADGFSLVYEGDPVDGGAAGVGGADAEGKLAEMDAEIQGYLMLHPKGVSGIAVRKAVAGRATRILARLDVVGTQGRGRKMATCSRLEAYTPGTGGTGCSRSCSRGCSAPVPTARNRRNRGCSRGCSRCSGPYRGTTHREQPAGCSRGCSRHGGGNHLNR